MPPPRYKCLVHLGRVNILSLSDIHIIAQTFVNDVEI